MRKTLFVFVTALVVTAVISSAHAAPYTVADLGTFPGGTFTQGFALNDSGQATGRARASSGGDRPFLYSGGTLTNLGTLGGASGIGGGINNSGQVAGTAFTSSGAEHAFLYSGGLMTDLGSLSGNFSAAADINSTSQIVGYSNIANGNTHVFLYSAGVMTDLGTPFGGTVAHGFGINDSGQLTGVSRTVGDAAAHGFVYTGGVVTDIGTLGGQNSQGNKINNAGQVAGFAMTSTGATHAIRYSGGVLTDLGTFGGTYSAGLGINNAGQVVGETLDGSGGRHAFLWSGGVMTDLNTFAPLGVTFWAASDINDAGQILTYDCTGGTCRSYLLTPTSAVPAPGTVWLVASGLLALGSVARMRARRFALIRR